MHLAVWLQDLRQTGTDRYGTDNPPQSFAFFEGAAHRVRALGQNLEPAAIVNVGQAPQHWRFDVMRKLALVAAVSLLTVGSALADETTTVQHRDAVPPVVGTVVGKPLGDPGGTTVTRTRDPGCGSTTVHRENGAGDSKTVKRSDC